MFVLDTNTLIYFFKGQGQVSANLMSVLPEAVFVPTVVLYELQVGIAKSTSPERRSQQLRQLVERVNVVGFDESAAMAAAAIRADLERRGSPIGPIDVLIAGMAVSLGARLVTHNVAEFSRVQGLTVVDWF